MKVLVAVTSVALIAACTPNEAPAAARASLVASSEARVIAPSPSDGDWHGFAVDLDGATLVVGAHGDDTRAMDAGAAHVFVWSGSAWSHQATLTASDGTARDYFGWDVAVSGDTIVIGARRDDARGTDYGSAYVFARTGTTWTEQQKLYPSDGAATDRFGWSVDVEGTTLLVGAVTHDGPAMDSGAAYVFVRSGTTWTEQAKLTASDGTGGDFLGQSLALDGDTALVGADEDNVGGPDSGSAYVFVRSGTTWTEQAKLAASDSAAEDFFANGVALDGDTALLGAWGRDDGAVDAGGAYVFVRSGTTWTQQAKLLAPDPIAEDNLGREVALAGDAAIVGSFLDDTSGADRGEVYVWQRSGTTWSLRSRTQASAGAAGDQYGWALATDGVRVAVGAPFADPGADAAGAVWTYLLSGGATPPVDAGFDAGPPPPADAGTDAGSIGSSDAGASIDSGSPSDASVSTDAGAGPGDAGLDADAGGISSDADAGTGTPTDAGADADASSDRDAGRSTDASAADAGGAPPGDGDGCSCGTAGASRHTSLALWVIVLALLVRRRRSS